MSERNGIPLNVFDRLTAMAKRLGPKQERKAFREAFQEQFAADPALRELAKNFGRSAPGTPAVPVANPKSEKAGESTD